MLAPSSDSNDGFQLYKLADKDGNGKLDKEELKDALTSLGFTHLGDAQVALQYLCAGCLVLPPTCTRSLSLHHELM